MQCVCACLCAFVLVQVIRSGGARLGQPPLSIDIASEVWDSIPIEDLRPFMTKTAERWKDIKKAKGEWVGWSKSSKSKRRKSHGVGN